MRLDSETHIRMSGKQALNFLQRRECLPPQGESQGLGMAIVAMMIKKNVGADAKGYWNSFKKDRLANVIILRRRHINYQ
jgi:hypothetical protein